MLTLDDKHIKQKLQFIDSYLNAETAADGAKLDANANVTHKNIARTMAFANMTKKEQQFVSVIFCIPGTLAMFVKRETVIYILMMISSSF